MIDKYRAEYYDYLDNGELKSNTIECYKRDVKLYVNYLIKNNIDVNRINTLVIKNFEESIKSDNNASINRIISSIRGFHKFLVSKKYLEKEPKYRTERFFCEEFEIEKHILNNSEIKQYFSVIKDENSRYALRDKTIIELLYKCGLKISEIEKLKISDINIDLSYINLTSMSNRVRVIPIDEAFAQRIKIYIQNYRSLLDVTEENKDYLFLNKDSEKITRQGIWKIIKKYEKLSGISKNINSNTFRLSLAYNLIGNGADPASINKYLGNKSYSTISKVSDQNIKLESSMLKFNIDFDKL